MAEFSVTVGIAHTVFIDVEADTKQEAEEKARWNVIGNLGDYCTEMDITAEVVDVLEAF